MSKRKRPRNDKGSAVGIDMESYPNAIVVSKPNGDVMFFPPRNNVVVEERSEHGHYDEKGNLIVTPLETRPQSGYNSKELGLD